MNWLLSQECNMHPSNVKQWHSFSFCFFRPRRDSLEFSRIGSHINAKTYRWKFPNSWNRVLLIFVVNVSGSSWHSISSCGIIEIKKLHHSTILNLYLKRELYNNGKLLLENFLSSKSINLIFCWFWLSWQQARQKLINIRSS